MSAASVSPWLGRAFVAALFVHAGLVVLFVVAGLWAAGFRVIADSAPGGLLFSAVTFFSVALAAIPSSVALLSAWLCRRRGWRPSAGHMALSVSAAALFLILFSWVYLT